MIHIERLEQLVDICIAISAEKDAERLLEMIVESACLLANADGGTVYVVHDDWVTIKILRNATLALKLGGHAGMPPHLASIPLHKADGSPNLNNVVTYAIHKNLTVNISDSYDTSQFDFSGTRSFDASTGYRSRSFLTVPLRNHENEIVGVLQLINAQDPGDGRVVDFDANTVRYIEALASQAAITLTREQLISDLQNLFDALIRLMADSIDRKSSYTGGHCRRVPTITMMLAEAAHQEETGLFADFKLTDRDRRELEVACWLHDCGKITTPEYVVDKATKLETIHDRIEMVATRFEVLKRDVEIAALKRQLAALGVGEPTLEFQAGLQVEHARLDEELAYLRHANIGGESMRDEDIARIGRIGAQIWLRDGQGVPLLDADEIKNLGIRRGTLTQEEREVINEHIVVTIEMLNALPLPKHLRNVPEYAGGHHERMDGKGFPKGLRREEMSVQARILGIADIFEALTAGDRPYKPGKKMSEVLQIMRRMKDTGHIDPDLFDVFVKHKLYLRYARQYLPPSQVDVDE